MSNVRTDEAIRGLMGVTARMAGAMAWMAVAFVHLGLVLSLLVSAWLWRVTPLAVSNMGRSLVPDWLEPSIPGKLVYFGVPITLGLWAYMRAWRWVLRRVVLRYLLRGP